MRGSWAETAEASIQRTCRPCFSAGISLMRTDDVCQPFSACGGQSQSVDLLSKHLARPVACHVPVDARNGRGCEKIAQGRIHTFVLLHELRPSPERIFLVIPFCQGEPRGRQDLRTHSGIPPSGLPVPRSDGSVFLLVTVVEDDRHVLPPTGPSRRVMAFPEDIEQILVGDYGRIKIYLHRFGVIPDSSVCRILCRTSRVPHAGPHDPGKTPEPGVGTPESTHSEGRRPRAFRSRNVDRWLHRELRHRFRSHPACHCRPPRIQSMIFRSSRGLRGKTKRRNRCRTKQCNGGCPDAPVKIPHGPPYPLLLPVNSPFPDKFPPGSALRPSLPR